MRHAVWLLIAGAAGLISEGRPASPPPSLAREMLAAHNSVRGRVGRAALVWSDRLAARAQEWADTLLARKQFVHRPNSTYGENLFEITGMSATSAQVVSSWAGESRNYDYHANKCSGVCGHYTQIVWGDTKEAGCAVARGGGREVWVCNYDPPGNWIGKRPY
jgi:pathogenesis-related protein 1